MTDHEARPAARSRRPPLLLLPLPLLLAAVDARAQSLLDRPPNMAGAWTGAPGTLYFHFVHRFSASAAPERKVSSVPTFLVAAGLPKRFLAGVNYSTNSTLAPGVPNEWELLGRWAPVAQDYGAPLDLGGQVDYNNAARGVDAELSAARRVGPARLLVAGRALANSADGGAERYAVAGGVAVRVGTYVSVTGDVASLTSRAPDERAAWSAGLHVALPLTPHTLSIQATNALVTTLQGASRGTRDVRYGFEFTIPLTLRRYFSRPPAVPPPAAAATVGAGRSAAAPDSAATTMPASPADTLRTVIKNISYLQPRLEVAAGTTVEWTNADPLAHTVTAADGAFDSELIQPGRTFRHTFTKAGTYAYSCTPHPFMTGVVVVGAP